VQQGLSYFSAENSHRFAYLFILHRFDSLAPERDLIEWRAAGYDPLDWIDYPENAQRAGRIVAARRAQQAGGRDDDAVTRGGLAGCMRRLQWSSATAALARCLDGWWPAFCRQVKG
jgi:hypothetical protein